jgi:hypothetical protein
MGVGYISRIMNPVHCAGLSCGGKGRKSTQEPEAQRLACSDFSSR